MSNPVGNTPEADAVMNRIIAQATAGGHPPPTQTPAPPPSGGSSRSAGGSGSSGGGHPPPAPGPSGSDDDRKKKLQILLAGLVVCACIFVAGYGALIVTAFKTTTPEGRAHVEKILAYDDRVQARKHEEIMAKEATKQARIREQAKKLSPTPSLPKVCMDGSTISSSRLSPIVLQAGNCFTRPMMPANFWVVFQAPPKTIQGVVSFGEVDPRQDAEGKVAFWEKSHCITSQVADQCMSYLASRLNVPLVVFNNTSPLSIN